MALIAETIVTTSSKNGDVHIAPLGLIETEGGRWTIAPFKPSRTLDNLRDVPFAVANHTDDVRVYAGCLTGRRDWAVRKADDVPGGVLESALSHWELAVEDVIEDDVRPRFVCRIAKVGNHAPWTGYNRAQAAVLECAVLVSRLKMLPAEKVESELKYLEISIEKTAGPREEEAWSWLMERIEAWRREG
ncbi:MAG: DUF447 domain-containing protein [Hyphomicrobiaceae bacterium]